MFSKGDKVMDVEGEVCTILNDNGNGTFLVQFDDGLIMTVDEFVLMPLSEPDLDFFDEEWYDDEDDLEKYRELARYNEF
jgi:hypothetical protein